MRRAIQHLQSDPTVIHVEPNYLVQLEQEEPGVPLPNDFHFDRSWGLNNTGKFDGTVDADIDLPEAWELGTGSRNVRVAVIDTGIDFFHPDLRENLWVNEAEVDGNGIDDDQNGFIDDIHGFDFISEDGDPFDDQNHGTHVAGIIGAVANNNLGSAGVSPEVSMIAVKTFGVSGSADVATVVRGVRYAIDQGAHIINASWGVDVRSEVMRMAVEETAAADILFVAAGGNRQSAQFFYPAAFHDTIGVGATDKHDQRARFSNYGSFIDLAAPGQAIFSTLPDNRFGFLNGTSMAAPHVTGTAVLALARHPAWTSLDLTRLILNSVDSIQVDKMLGSGRLNVWKAQQIVEPLPRAELELPDIIGGLIPVKGSADGERFSHFLLDIGAGASPEEWQRLHRLDQAITETTLLPDFQTARFEDGTYCFRLQVVDQLNQTNTVKQIIEIANVEISHPMNHDVIRTGDVITIVGSAYGNARKYTLEYGEGVSPDAWSDAGITLNHSTGITPYQEALGTWNTQGLEPNRLYTLRLSATDDTGQVETEYVRALQLEPSMKPGFPIYHPTGLEVTAEDWRPVVVEDLDRDGKSEIIVVEVGDLFGTPTSLCVYHHNGTLAWKRELGSSVPFQDLPLTGDLDGDGYREIFTEGGTGGLLKAFRHDGQALSGAWPVETGAKALGKIMADLDQDGAHEIVALTHDPAGDGLSSRRELMIIEADGSIPYRWSLSACQQDLEAMELLPAVANMDNDPFLEIVCVNNCQSIGIYDLDQPESVKYTAIVSSGLLMTSPVIGDLDRDGHNEIIVTSNGTEHDTRAGVHVFNAQGQILAGFPTLQEEHFDSSPGLADLDGDNDLEIILSSHRSRLIHVLHHHGFPMQGWPVGPVKDGILQTTPLIADVNGDSKMNVLVPCFGSTLALLANGDLTRSSGLKAWDHTGNPVVIGLDNAKDRLWMDLPSGSLFKMAPPTLCDLDGDGQLDVVASTTIDLLYDQQNPRISLKHRHSIFAWGLNAPYQEELVPWPTYQKNNRRTGRFEAATRLNHSPEIRPIINQTIPRGQTFFPINLRRFEFDPDHASNELTWIIEEHVHLQWNLSDDRLLTVFPSDPQWTGEASLTISLEDPAGARDRVEISFRILENYRPPVAVQDNAETPEDTPVLISVLKNDRHPRHLPLRILEITPTLHGQATVTPEGLIRYMPKENYFGEDSLQYVITDDEGGIAIGEINIVIRPINDPPIAEADRIVLIEDGSVEFSPVLNDMDPDMDPVRLVEWTTPEQGMLNLLENGQMRYLPGKDFSGTDHFEYVISDDAGLESVGEVLLLVKGINDAPVAESQQHTMNRNRELNITYRAEDPDGDPLQYEIISPPEHGRVLDFPTVATYIPEFGFSGTDQFTYRANDGITDGPIATIQITITDHNNAPDTKNLHIITAVNQRVSIELEAEDADEDMFLFSIQTPVARGTLSIDAGVVHYDPPEDFKGLESASILVTDHLGATSKMQVTVEVTDINTAPEATDIGVEIFGNQDHSFDLAVVDRENNPLTFQWVSLPQNGSIQGDPPEVTYQPREGFFGFDRIQFIANDGELDSNLGTVVIEVQYPNHRPVGTNQTIRLQKNKPKLIHLEVEDVEEDPLRQVILKGPQHGVLSGKEGVLVYTPDPDFVGIDDFTWKVWDGLSYSNTGKVTLHVSTHDPDFRLRIESIHMIDDQKIEVIINAEPGRQYTLQTSEDFQRWEPVETLQASEANLTFLDRIDFKLNRLYYRVVLAP